MSFTSAEFREQLRPLWQAYLDQLEPLRPELFRFALGLTRNPFDAEDLVADGLLRAFSSRALDDNAVDNPRAYVARVMANLWIDQQRRNSPVPTGEVETASSAPDREGTEAAAEVLYSLEPRARAVLVLKDVLGFSHVEIAAMLSITPANAKVILHRAKRALAELQPRTPRASRACVQRFVDTFLTYDVDAIRALVTDDLVADNFPVGFGTGVDHHVEKGWIRGSFFHHVASHEAEHVPYPLRLEIHDVCGEPAVLVFRGHDPAPDTAGKLEEVWLVEEQDGRVARITDYCFRPDLVQWVGEHVKVPFRRLPYRYSGETPI